MSFGRSSTTSDRREETRGTVTDVSIPVRLESVNLGVNRAVQRRDGPIIRTSPVPVQTSLLSRSVSVDTSTVITSAVTPEGRSPRQSEPRLVDICVSSTRPRLDPSGLDPSVPP